MANPTTAKPTGPFRQWTNTAATVGELLRCYDPMLGDGPARDVVGNVLAVPSVGTAGHGTGHPPERIPGGFTGGGLSEASYRFRSGTTALVYTDRGWTTATIPLPHTIFAVIKVEAAAGPVARNVPLFGNGSLVVGQWVGYQVSTAGVITLGRFANSNTNFFNVTFSSASITLTSGEWYLVAITNTSTTASIWQVYNYTDQAYITTQATGNTVTHTAYSTPGTSTTAGPDAVFNPAVGYNTFENDCFVGEVACFGLSTATWNPATNGYFAAMVADPWVVARTADAGGGALTAKGVVAWDETTGGIHLRSNLPSGGTAGAKQCCFHRSTVPSFTPNIDTRLSSLGNNWEFVDTTALAGVNYWYKSEQYDGTTTVYSTTATSNSTQTCGRLSRGDLFFGLTSDSRWSNPQGRFVTALICKVLRSWGFRTGVRNCGLSSSRLRHPTDVDLSWQPNTTQDPINGQAGTTLLANLLAWCALEGITTIMSQSGVTDNGDEDADVNIGYYQIILDYLLSQGLSAILIRPSQALVAEARSLRLHNFSILMEDLDNGSTIRVARTNNYDLSCSSQESQHVDQLHYRVSDFEAFATAHGIADTLYPESGTIAALQATLDDLVFRLTEQTYPLPGQVTPPAEPTMLEAILYPYKRETNPMDQDNTTQKLYDRTGATVEQKRTITLVGGTLQLGAVVEGP